MKKKLERKIRKVENRGRLTDMQEEKIYYKDDNVKITDLRITANHVTVPIDKIENVTVDFKAVTLAAAITLFLLSLIAVVAGCYFYNKFCWLGILIVIAVLVWMRIVYQTYTELKISMGSRTIRLLESGMRDREKIFKIEEALKTALKEKPDKEN